MRFKRFVSSILQSVQNTREFFSGNLLCSVRLPCKYHPYKKKVSYFNHEKLYFGFVAFTCFVITYKRRTKKQVSPWLLNKFQSFLNEWHKKVFYSNGLHFSEIHKTILMNFPHTLHQILLIFIWISIWTHNRVAFQFKQKNLSIVKKFSIFPLHSYFACLSCSFTDVMIWSGAWKHFKPNTGQLKRIIELVAIPHETHISKLTHSLFTQIPTKWLNGSSLKLFFGAYFSQDFVDSSLRFTR